MNKDEVVRISRLAAFGGLTNSDINILLMNYCLEHNKPYYETTVKKRKHGKKRIIKI